MLFPHVTTDKLCFARDCLDHSLSFKIGETITFFTYSEDDLKFIIQDRVGEGVIAEPAVMLVAMKVAAISGDARKALELTSQAIGNCLESLSDQHLNDIVTGETLVKLPHMMRAIRESAGNAHTTIIEGLPQAAKIILCVAVALSQISPAWRVIQLGTLKRYCTEAFRHGLIEHLSIDHFYDLVQQLCDAGLLLTGGNNFVEDLRLHGEPYNIRISLGVQIDDVEIALNSTLMSQEFYRGMVQHVKKSNTHNNGRP